MKQKLLKKLLPVLISCGTVAALACAWGDYSGQQGSMFTPEIVNLPHYTPFFRTLETAFYDGYDDNSGADTLRKINVTDWKTYLGNVDEPAISFWLYEAEQGEVDSMNGKLNGKCCVPAGLPPGTDLTGIKNKKARSFLEFILFAKQSEKLFVSEGLWEEKQTDTSGLALRVQISKCSQLMNRSNDKFMKARYGYQLLRLYYASHEYNIGVRFWEQNKSLFNAAGENIKWRSLGYKAACYYRLKQYAEANYIYSLIFENFPPLQRSAYLSFHPQNEPEWSRTLALATTAPEKATLWLLQGLYSDGVQAMREIQRINPGTPKSDLLLVRAINIEEEKFQEVEENTFVIDEKLNAFLNEVVSLELRVNQPGCWLLAAAYHNYLKRDFVLADEQMKLARMHTSGSSLVKSQYHLLRVFGMISRVRNLSEISEQELVPDLWELMKEQSRSTKFRSAAAIEWVRNSLSKMAAQKGEFEKAELIMPGTLSRHFSDIENIRKMIAYFDEPDKSDLEKIFIASSIRTQYDYQKLLAIRLTYENRLEEALAAFGEGGRYGDVLPGNPFTIHIRDCHDCDHSAPQKTVYTNATFVEKMIEIKSIAQKKPKEAAQNYFLLANGFYNLTWFGNARAFSDSEVYPSFYTNDTLTPQPSVKLALEYYLKAREASDDKEFKAKCTFMAAKCENNLDFGTDLWVYDYSISEPGTFYEQLKKNCSGTKYYNEIIRECSWFRKYAQP